MSGEWFPLLVPISTFPKSSAITALPCLSCRRASSPPPSSSCCRPHVPHPSITPPGELSCKERRGHLPVSDSWAKCTFRRRIVHSEDGFLLLNFCLIVEGWPEHHLTISFSGFNWLWPFFILRVLFPSLLWWFPPFSPFPSLFFLYFLSNPLIFLCFIVKWMTSLKCIFRKWKSYIIKPIIGAFLSIISTHECTPILCLCYTYTHIYLCLYLYLYLALINLQWLSTCLPSVMLGAIIS